MRWLTIKEIPTITKTKQFCVRASDDSEDILGYIKFYPRWRKFSFFPIKNTLFNNSKGQTTTREIISEAYFEPSAVLLNDDLFEDPFADYVDRIKLKAADAKKRAKKPKPLKCTGISGPPIAGLVCRRERYHGSMHTAKIDERYALDWDNDTYNIWARPHNEL